MTPIHWLRTKLSAAEERRITAIYGLQPISCQWELPKRFWREKHTLCRGIASYQSNTGRCLCRKHAIEYAMTEGK